MDDPMDTDSLHDPHAAAYVAPAAHPAPPAHIQSDTASMVTTPSLQIDDRWDRDSALGDMSNMSSTMSVASSIYDHVVENVGTRQIRYCLLRPCMPAPPNVSFEICDAEDEWSFSQKFDFIHMRAIVTCFADPKAVFAQAYEALEPGGWIELRDPIMPFQYVTPPPENCALKEWGDKIIEAAARIGRHWTNAQYYSEWLQELGFVNIVETREHVGLNPWMKGSRNKHLAVLLGSDMSNGLESMSMALFTRVLGWEPERVHELLERVRQDMADPKVHAYSEGVHVYAMKPYNAI
ncbi:hypothetical protein DL766_010127 [Monosporascus sp. MC13-8B]|uniref:Methyltransferase type 11 domain-containing protein n=1 Tax=Monosporascus cannonballus TaxID=155416 RepID=A0ABY0GTW5_9PEZI|nr:hypothetical protein DL762_009422 [Monosporascus cannonballus]RYO77532.1 hypothetical protein DL763_009957 [Monosporascus cannonballus]RYP09826.1 hypothetical protein DL766_010127 [Monosporascus sp. MC13-8B]